MRGAARHLRGGPSPGGGDLWERLALAGVAVAAYLSAANWVTAQICARIATGSWLPVNLTDAAVALLALPATAGEPAAAWPAEATTALPGALPYWLVFMALVALPAAAVGWPLARAARRRAAEQPQPARWARPTDLRSLRVRRPTPGRITLGRDPHGRLLAAEPRQSLIVFGPSQSGKTTGLAIPAILEWQGPVIATSVKADLLRDTLTARRSVGETWVYDPSGTLRGDPPTATWTPLAGCATWQGAQKTAAWLTSSARDPSLRESDFWYATAAKLLAPYLFAAATSGRTMADVVRWLDTQEEQEVRFELELAGVPEAVHAVEASWAREDRQRSSVFTTAETIVDTFADPAVAASATGCDITAERLLDGGRHTLYVCAPAHEQTRLRPLFTTLLQQLLAAAYERSAARGLLDPPLLLVLDEAANIAPLPDLDALVSTAAGVGIQVVTIWQDAAQIHARYGDRAATVLNNHRAKLALSGISDPKTLSYLSELGGDTLADRVSRTTGLDGTRSATVAQHAERLVAAPTLRTLSRGAGLLVYGALPPARLRLGPPRSQLSSPPRVCVAEPHRSTQRRS